ncbi:hypothetical protein M405DRAFT_842987 [Rhizopogon salebrosus TDB-379]|nr:hypothetical protein M405DRAFT_842987 [Rhizopogon salebrosus TDB-379]
MSTSTSSTASTSSTTSTSGTASGTAVPTGTAVVGAPGNPQNLLLSGEIRLLSAEAILLCFMPICSRIMYILPEPQRPLLISIPFGFRAIVFGLPEHKITFQGDRSGWWLTMPQLRQHQPSRNGDSGGIGEFRGKWVKYAIWSWEIPVHCPTITGHMIAAYYFRCLQALYCHEEQSVFQSPQRLPLGHGNANTNLVGIFGTRTSSDNDMPHPLSLMDTTGSARVGSVQATATFSNTFVISSSTTTISANPTPHIEGRHESRRTLILSKRPGSSTSQWAQCDERTRHFLRLWVSSLGMRSACTAENAGTGRISPIFSESWWWIL